MKIDGTTYTSPRTLSVDKGTSHTIQVISPQEQDDTSKVSGTDMKYTFEKWTDGNTANPRTVTVNSDVTYTAQMKVECKIETATQPLHNDDCGKRMVHSKHKQDIHCSYSDGVYLQSLASQWR